MHPTATHDLTYIRQADLHREAAEHRLAKIAQAGATKTSVAAKPGGHGFDLKAAVTSLFRTRQTPKTNPI
jgi:hypothetical protein